MSSGYPAHREADVVLHDGSTVRLRPVRPRDQGALQGLFERLSDRSRAFRFFSGAVDLGVPVPLTHRAPADAEGSVAVN